MKQQRLFFMACLSLFILITALGDQMLNTQASEKIIVAIKQDNFVGTTTQLDQTFRRSGMAFYNGS